MREKIMRIFFSFLGVFGFLLTAITCTAGFIDVCVSGASWDMVENQILLKLGLTVGFLAFAVSMLAGGPFMDIRLSWKPYKAYSLVRTTGLVFVLYIVISGTFKLLGVFPGYAFEYGWWLPTSMVGYGLTLYCFGLFGDPTFQSRLQEVQNAQ